MSSWVLRIVLVGASLIWLLQPAMGQRAWGYPPVFDDANEFTYREIDNVKLQAWVFEPAGVGEGSDRPAVVFFFGGGWRAGTPAQFADQCRYLASRGVVAITCDYRVASRHQVKAVSCVDDARHAIRWVRENARLLGVDPQRICAAGGSAGGHIACCTGVVPDPAAARGGQAVSSVPNAMALFNPAVMLAPLDGVDSSPLQLKMMSGMAARTGVEPIQISPVHHVAAGQPPTIIFHGMSDTTVPYATVEEFARRSEAVGNDVKLVGYEGAPHGFFNNRGGTPQDSDQSLQWYRATVQQLDLFLARLGWIQGDPTERFVSEHVRIRRYLDASRHVFEAKKAGRVAFLGGSITEMPGYRLQVEEWLQKQYPETEFEFINAGISSTCSHTGAFRLQRDVLSHGKVDLMFVEFAVNDDQDAGHSPQNCVRGMEGVIRHALLSNPAMDVVMLHFPNDGMLATIDAGDEPVASGRHESVARHYGVSSIYLSRYVAQEISKGNLKWEEYGGTHPKLPGNTVVANLVTQLLDQGWRSGCPAREPVAVELPTPLDPGSFSHGRLITPSDEAIEASAEWRRDVPEWDSLPGSKRARFTKKIMLHTEKLGATLRYRFSGNAVGVYLLAGPDAGAVQYRLDGGEWQTADLLHHYSKDLHYPRTVMFAVGLEEAEHLLELATQLPRSDRRRTGVRMLGLVVNESGEIHAGTASRGPGVQAVRE